MTLEQHLRNHTNTPRLVTCLKCKIDVETDEFNPKCKKCKSTLIAIVISSITGERLTGVPRNADHLLIPR